jgi:hypothetical protein
VRAAIQLRCFILRDVIVLGIVHSAIQANLRIRGPMHKMDEGGTPDNENIMIVIQRCDCDRDKALSLLTVIIYPNRDYVQQPRTSRTDITSHRGPTMTQNEP